MSVVDHRRALHRIPELDNQLPETVQLVRSALAPLPCRVFSPITGSVCAWFDAGKSDAVAFRAELDALPVTGGHGPALRLRPPREDARLRPRRPHRHGPDPGGIRGGAPGGAAPERAVPLPAVGGDHRRRRQAVRDRRAGAAPGPPDLRPPPVAGPGGRRHRLPPRPADGPVQRGHRHRGGPQRPHVPGGRGAGRPDGGDLLPPAGL